MRRYESPRLVRFGTIASITRDASVGLGSSCNDGGTHDADPEGSNTSGDGGTDGDCNAGDGNPYNAD